MTTFAVTYVYDDQQALRAEHRGAHRAFLAGLFAAGVVRASGPVSDGHFEGALIIISAESKAAVETILAADPFAHAGVIAQSVIVEWTLVLGPWT